MAVEIPVVIDIERAFNEATAHLPKAMKPLQDYMDSNALAINLRIDGSKKMMVKDILDDATLSAKQLKTSLADIEAMIARRAAAGGFDLSAGLTKSEQAMLQAYGALEVKINKVADGSALMRKLFSVNIDKTKAKITELTTEIDKLTRKQNHYYQTVDGKRVQGGKAYERTKAQIQSANAELTTAKRNLSLLTVELEKITAAGVKAATAIGSISTPAMQMAESWRRGATYVERYNASLGVANNRLLMLVKSSLSLVALHAGMNFVRNIRQVTSEFEMQRVALGGIIQDTQEAERLFKQIKAAAIQSPFEIKDLVSFTKQLSAYRIETDKLFDVTMRLADVSAGLGVDMSRLVLAYGQVRAASVLRGQELRQFTEAGIPLVDELAKKFRALGREGTTTADVFELISKRAVPFSMIEEIFNDMTNAGGIFYKMQEKQSETLKGQWMKLKDALSIMYDEIGNTKAVHKAMGDLLSYAMGLMQNWKETGRAVGVAVAAMVAYKIAIANARVAATALTAAEVAEVSALSLNTVGRSRLIAAIFGETAATKVQIVAGNLYVKMKEREMMATNLFSRALYRMTAALLANPYALAIAGATALAAILIKLAKASQDTAISTDELQKSIAQFDKASRHAQSVNELVSAYEELSSQSKLTSDDQQRLERVTQELAKTFPQAVTGINKETGALELNVQRVRELTRAEIELEEARLRAQAKRARRTIDDLETERDAIIKKYEMGGENVELRGAAPIWRPFTDEELGVMGERLRAINEELATMKDAVGQVDELDFIGPLQKEDADAQKILPEWKKKLSEIQAIKVKAGAAPVFANDEIEKLESVGDLYKKIKKEVEDAKKNLEGLRNIQTTLTDEAARQSNEKDIVAAEKYADLLEAIRIAFGFTFGKSSGRDNRLSQLKSDISELTNAYKKFKELQQYKTKDEALIDINTLFPQLEGKIPSLDYVVSELEKRLEQVKRDLAKSPKSKTLLDMKRALETEISNLKFDDLKDELERKLKRVSEEIKHSETARNFYKDIFALTGDEKLATSLSVEVYGGIGSDFKSNMQRQLNALFEGMELEPDMRKAIDEKDFDYILENLPAGLEKVRDKIIEYRDAQQKFSADQIKTWVNELKHAKTYSEQRVELARKTQERIAEINQSSLDQAEKDKLIAQYAKKEAEEAAKIQYEAFKDSPMYIKMFDDLDHATESMLRTMRDRIAEMSAQWKDLDPTQLKEMQSRLNDIDQQLVRRNPFKVLGDSIKQYNALIRKGFTQGNISSGLADAEENYSHQQDALEAALATASAKEREYKAAYKLYGLTAPQTALAYSQWQTAKRNVETQQKAVDRAKEGADAAAKNASEWDNIRKNVSAAVQELGGYASVLSEIGAQVEAAMSVFVSDEAADYARRTTEVVSTFAQSILKVADAAMKAEEGDIIGVFASAGQGLLGFVSAGIQLSSLLDNLHISDLTEEFNEQDKIITRLQRQYDKLDKALDEAFGNDYLYNYTSQLENLEAQQAAYLQQIIIQQKIATEASKEETRDAAKEQIEELQVLVDGTKQSMQDVQRNMQEFYIGSSLTQAAEDFASAWLDAYQSYGSTVDAIKDKMQDMINNLIVKSTMAKAAEVILRPFYDKIQELADNGTLNSASGIADLTNTLTGLTGQLNAGLSTAAQVLQSAGINMRGTTTNLKGISRDIASASEESILGLAAGINTQNYYMSFVPTISADLKLIAEIMAVGTGQATATVPDITPEGDVMPSIQEMVYDHMPNIDRNIAEISRLVSNVIKPNGTAAPYYVATKM